MRNLISCVSVALLATAMSDSAWAVDFVSVDPDAFPLGTNISNAFPGVTLSSVGRGFDGDFDPEIFSIDPTAHSQPFNASTGTLVFGTNDPNIPHVFQASGDARLRVDFDDPVNEVLLDAIGNDSSDFAMLEAFDAANSLLDTYSTARLTTSAFETMVVTTAGFDIAYVVATGVGGDTVGLDNLEYAGSRCFVIDAINDQFSVIEDGTTADFFVLANDECSSDTPISVVELPGDLLPDRGGSATTDGAKVNYTPAAGFVGFEQFTYTAQDAGLDGGDDPPAVDQDTATVVVNVVEDITPDAVDDVATTSENQATIIDVLENDSLGNAPNQVEIETEPSNGSATVQGDETIRYSPNSNFFGEDSFEYRLTDANGDSDVATVTVGVFFVRGQVPIDIMPTDDGNNVNLRAGPGAGISVAILSVGEFFEAPNLIDPLTLKFGPRQGNIFGSPQVRDLDGDGDEDLVVKFLTQQTGIACGDTQASLSGRTFDSQSISGSDAINTFNCPRIRKRH